MPRIRPEARLCDGLASRRPQPEHTLIGPPAVLIVEDEQCIRDILAELFEGEGTVTRAVGSVVEAQRALGEQGFDLIVTDLRLGGQRDGGLQVMAASGMLAPDAMVIVLTAYPDDDFRHASMRLGAAHFIEKPADLRTIAALALEAGVPSAIYPAGAGVREGMGGR
jgi:DNA-binding NtrC family response regulator